MTNVSSSAPLSEPLPPSLPSPAHSTFPAAPPVPLPSSLPLAESTPPTPPVAPAPGPRWRGIVIAVPPLLLLSGMVTLALVLDHSPPPVAPAPTVAPATPENVSPPTEAAPTFDPGAQGTLNGLFGANVPPPGTPPGAEGSLFAQGLTPGTGAKQAKSAPPAPRKAARPNPIEVAFARGVKAQQAGKTDAAITAYREVLRLNPGAIPAHLNLSILYLQLRRPLDALSHARTAARLDPKNPAAAGQLAQILVTVGRPREAVAPLRQVIGLDPKNRRARVFLAQLLMSLKQPEQAYGEWKRLAEMAPDDAEAAFAAGAIALDPLKRVAESERWLRQAARQPLKDPRVPLLLGRVLAVRGKGAEANEVLTAAASRYPRYIELHTLLAEVRWSRGDKNGAIVALRTIAQRVPASLEKGVPRARLQAGLGRLHAMREDWPAAAREWKSATALLPRDADLHAMLAEALLRSGDRGGGLAALRRVLQLDPKRHGARRVLARVLVDLKRPKQALAEYQAYVKAQPRDTVALSELANLHEAQGRAAPALAVWRDVARILPHDPLPPLHQARLLRKLGRESDALNNYRLVLQLQPNQPRALLGAAELEEKSGQTMRALAHLRALVATEPDYEPAYALLMRVAATKDQLPATVNFLKQQLVKNPNRRPVYTAILESYEKAGKVDEGRAIVKELMGRYPKATAPRLALDAFDLARARQQLIELQKTKPAGTPTPSATVTPPIPTTTPPAASTPAPVDPDAH